MMEKVSTYEEAKRVIVGSVDSLTSRHNWRVLKRGFLIYIAIFIASEAVAWFALKDVRLLYVATPFGIPCVIRAITLRLYGRNQKRILNGTYFDKKSEEEVIKAANDYIDTCNKVNDRLLKEEQHLPFLMRIVDRF